MGVLNAKNQTDILRSQIEDMWGHATPEDAYEKLSSKDVAVTNEGDKEAQLAKIQTLQLSVRLAIAAVAAEKELAYIARRAH